MAIIEGAVRQSTDNPVQKFELMMLENPRKITGYSVQKPEGSVLIDTEEGGIPIYMFRMNEQLQALLVRDQEVWDV
tara:strand:+ start:357 stop:584 length:228 start_codon:yes stop_codon:yes gene_type:complete